MKHSCVTEPYAKSHLARCQSSLVVQLRTGTVLLALDVGRFENIQQENRLCELCSFVLRRG